MHVQQFSAHESTPKPQANTEGFQHAFNWVLRAGLIAVLGLGLGYLMMLNALATLGFDLENLKAENLAHKKEMEKWDIEIAIPSSLYALESLKQVQEMDKIERKTYLTIESDDVAMVKVVEQFQ